MVWCEAALILTIKWDEPDILLLLFFLGAKRPLQITLSIHMYVHILLYNVVCMFLSTR